MDFTGGRIDRLVLESARMMIRDGLDDLGWLSADALHQLITVPAKPVDVYTEIKTNTVMVDLEDVDGEDIELGSTLATDSFALVVDVLMESAALVKEVAGDVRALLRGRLPSVGRTAAVLRVYDWSTATPAQVAWCEIEDVRSRQSEGFSDPFLKNWRRISCSLTLEGV